jgi:hypothetical protein
MKNEVQCFHSLYTLLGNYFKSTCLVLHTLNNVLGTPNYKQNQHLSLSFDMLIHILAFATLISNLHK